MSMATSDSLRSCDMNTFPYRYVYEERSIGDGGGGAALFRISDNGNIDWLSGAKAYETARADVANGCAYTAKKDGETMPQDKIDRIFGVSK